MACWWEDDLIRICQGVQFGPDDLCVVGGRQLDVTTQPPPGAVGATQHQMFFEDP